MDSPGTKKQVAVMLEFSFFRINMGFPRFPETDASPKYTVNLYIINYLFQTCLNWKSHAP